MEYMVMDLRNTNTGEVDYRFMVKAKAAPGVGDPEKECIACLKPIPSEREQWAQFPNRDGVPMYTFCGKCLPPKRRDAIFADLAVLWAGQPGLQVQNSSEN
jgi:hypothetical protein